MDEFYLGFVHINLGSFVLAKPKLVPKQLISQLQFQVGKVRIPRILLGTSPFIGSGQFGSRASLYYTHFYENPHNIVKVMCKAVDLGVTGVQVLPHRKLFGALRFVEREIGERLTVVGSVGRHDPLGDIREFQRFKTVAMLLHGELTDKRDSKKISELLNQVHATNCLAGLATHKPLSTLDWLLKADLDVDLLMLPFNRSGMFMDGKPVEVAKAIKRVGKPVIGKKVLAAGQLSPKEALTYVAKLGCVNIVALGVASEKEAEETFTVAVKAFSGTVRA